MNQFSWTPICYSYPHLLHCRFVQPKRIQAKYMRLPVVLTALHKLGGWLVDYRPIPVQTLPRLVNTCRSSAELMNPFPSLSNTRSPSIKSSIVPCSFLFWQERKIGRNSSKLTRLLPRRVGKVVLCRWTMFLSGADCLQYEMQERMGIIFIMNSTRTGVPILSLFQWFLLSKTYHWGQSLGQSSSLQPQWGLG